MRRPKKNITGGTESTSIDAIEKPYPLYSQEIAPYDYHLFHSMAHGLTDQQFREKDDINKMAWFVDSLIR